MALPPATDGSYEGNRLIIFTAVFIPVQILCVALRYFARWVIKGPWGWDDVLIFVSLFLQLCQAGVSISSVHNAGVGYHIPWLLATDPEKVTIWGKYLVAISMIYFAGVNIPKLAILGLYHRLFPSKGIRLVIHILMVALVGLTISLVITNFSACRPFAGNWNPEIKGLYCIDKEAFFIWSSIPNIVTDVILLILPMRVVWNLHASTRLKVGLTMTFAMGSFGLITSIIRFTTFFQNNSFVDGTWSAVDLIIWTQIEAGVYLISACMPTWRPLLERIGRKDWVKKIANRTKGNTMGGLTNNKSKSDATSNIQLSHLSVRGQGFQRLNESQDKQSQNIVVTKDFTVEEHDQSEDELADAQRNNNSRNNEFDWGAPTQQ